MQILLAHLLHYKLEDYLAIAINEVIASGNAILN